MNLSNVAKAVCSIVILGCVTLSTASKDELKRKLDIQLNPGCSKKECRNPKGPMVNLVHVRATGDDDAIHYLWSSDGAPTMIVAYADKDSNLTVDWKKYLSKDIRKSVSISGVQYSFASVFTKLWEYDDVNDVAKMDQVKQTAKYFKHTDLKNLTWRDFGKSMDNKSCSGTFLSSETDFPNGTVAFQMRAFGEEGRHNVLPSMQHNANNSQFDFVIDGLAPTYNHSRFALEMTLISSYKPADNIGMATKFSRSIDDEYTPGVFKIIQVEAPAPPVKDMFGGFIEWKPVFYTSSHHTIDDSKQTQHYDLQYASKELPRSLALAYFGEGDNLLVEAANVSFGMPEDGFYNAYNYAFWTAIVGYGDPPIDTVSITVIIIIIAGVGLPVLLILGGGVYLVIRRRKNKKDGERKPLLSGYVVGDSGAVNN